MFSALYQLKEIFNAYLLFYECSNALMFREMIIAVRNSQTFVSRYTGSQKSCRALRVHIVFLTESVSGFHCSWDPYLEPAGALHSQRKVTRITLPQLSAPRNASFASVVPQSQLVEHYWPGQTFATNLEKFVDNCTFSFRQLSSLAQYADEFILRKLT